VSLAASTFSRADLHDADRRRAAVLALVAHLSSSALAWTGPVGVARVDLDLPDGARESWALRFAPGAVNLVDPVGAEPGVVVRLPLAAALDLAEGTADGALLHLAGVLEVDGDEELVLAIGALVRVGADRTLIDAAALDPLAVSRAIAGARTEHLAAVMAGGFRELVLSEVFRRLPGFVIAEKAAKVDLAVAFEVGGRPDSQVDRYVVRIRHGVCTVTADPYAEHEAGATLVLDGHEFLRLVLGHLNPVRAVLSGELTVKGQLIKALGFNSVMQIPGR
jgi:putative sterol carrier protein